MGLIVTELSKAFAGKTAVDRLSFEIAKPGVFGLIGTNGAGKTTTIRMILGILPADSGTAEWNGQKISRETVRFGYMPEERGLYMKTKTLEQLVYFGELHGMTRRDATAEAHRLCERLGITEYLDMTAEKLSKGNQQKLQLAVTLIHRPELIFLDEPFSGLDPLNAEVLNSLIHELVDDGCSIVMSSHMMETVEKYCENLVILHRGHSILQGNLRRIKNNYGRTNLIIGADADLSAYASCSGAVLVEERAEESEYKIETEAVAHRLLQTLLQNGIYPYKYELRAPSLHEIFIEKTLAAQQSDRDSD